MEAAMQQLPDLTNDPNEMRNIPISRAARDAFEKEGTKYEHTMAGKLLLLIVSAWDGERQT